MTTWQLADHFREMFRRADKDNVEETLKDIDEYLTKMLKEWEPL